MSHARPGIDGCNECGVRVLFGLTTHGDVIALDPAPNVGPLVVTWDCTDTPRVRHQPGGRLREEEHRYARHVLSCIALAPVVELFPPQPPVRRRA